MHLCGLQLIILLVFVLASRWRCTWSYWREVSVNVSCHWCRSFESRKKDVIWFAEGCFKFIIISNITKWWLSENFHDLKIIRSHGEFSVTYGNVIQQHKQDIFYQHQGIFKYKYKVYCLVMMQLLGSGALCFTICVLALKRAFVSVLHLLIHWRNKFHKVFFYFGLFRGWSVIDCQVEFGVWLVREGKISCWMKCVKPRPSSLARPTELS